MSISVANLVELLIKCGFDSKR